MTTFPSKTASLQVGLFLATIVPTAMVGCAREASEAASAPEPKRTEEHPPAENPPEVKDAGKDAITIGTRGSITSKVLGEERNFLVYTPDSYGDPGREFPVLYLLDGDAHFHHVTGLMAFLGNVGRVPPMIVVGVSNTDRGRDFTPSHQEQNPTSGGAENFIRFLETELIPTVEDKYRTQPYRILVGHSLGGLLAAHILVERPEMFDAYLAVSPALHWDDGLVLRRATERWKDGKTPERFFYFTLGEEPENITRANQDFAAFLQASASPQLTWSFEHMKDENHGTTPHRTVHTGLNKLFAGWQLPDAMEDPLAIKEHYESLSKQFRLPVSPPENALNQLGYRLLGENRGKEAIDIFRMMVDAYPTSPNAYDSLGEGLEKSGAKEEALANYDLAVKYGTSQNHPLLATFTQNRDRLREQADQTTKPVH